MGRRQQLHQILKTFCNNVYFQPPTGLQMVYPAIVYNRDYALTAFADNKAYRRTKRYQVTIIDKNPDSEIPDMVADLPMSTFSRFFAVDQLNHDIYDVYF